MEQRLYNIGTSYIWDVNTVFDYKNFVVSGIGVDALFKLCKGSKSFYFEAYEEERENGYLPDKAMFDDFYVSELIYMVIDPSDERVIWSEPNYPRVAEAFKRKFGFSIEIEKYYLEGTFLPPYYIEVPPDLNPNEYPASKGYVVSYPDHTCISVTREEFAEIILNHKIKHKYSSSLGYFTKDIKTYTGGVKRHGTEK